MHQGKLRGALLRWFSEITELGPNPTLTSATRLMQLATWTEVRIEIEAVASPERRGELYSVQKDGQAVLRSASLLEETGLSNVAAALASGYYVDVDAVVDYITGALVAAPPTVDFWWLVDARLPLGTGFSAAEHQLETVDRDRIVGLAPIPPAYDFLPARQRIDADHFQNSTFLHRSEPDLAPARGLRLPFLTGRPELKIWRPMLALALWRREVLRVEACWAVERGRRVDVMYDDVVVEIGSYGPDPSDEYEFHRQSLYEVDGEESASRLATFVSAVDGCIANVLATGPISGSGPRKRRSRRLRRSAEHILRASQRSFNVGEALDDEERDEVLLHYVIAVEALLAQQESELSRRVSQRAAALFDRDSDRVEVADIIQHSYNLRSKYVHGDDTGSFSLERVREVVLSVVLRWLVLQSRYSDADAVTNVLDRSLLSDSVRSTEIEAIITSFTTVAPCPLMSGFNRS